MEGNFFGILFAIGGLVFTLLLWIIPAIILWKWRLERRIYFINCILGLLFLFVMYKLIATKPRELYEFFRVAEEMFNALIAWWLWGAMLLIYAILRRLMKQNDKENDF